MRNINGRGPVIHVSETPWELLWGHYCRGSMLLTRSGSRKQIIFRDACIIEAHSIDFDTHSLKYLLSNQ